MAKVVKRGKLLEKEVKKKIRADDKIFCLISAF